MSSSNPSSIENVYPEIVEEFDDPQEAVNQEMNRFAAAAERNAEAQEQLDQLMENIEMPNNDTGLYHFAGIARDASRLLEEGSASMEEAVEYFEQQMEESPEGNPNVNININHVPDSDRRDYLGLAALLGGGALVGGSGIIGFLLAKDEVHRGTRSSNGSNTGGRETGAGDPQANNGSQDKLEELPPGYQQDIPGDCSKDWTAVTQDLVDQGYVGGEYFPDGKINTDEVAFKKEDGHLYVRAYNHEQEDWFDLIRYEDGTCQ